MKHQCQAHKTRCMEQAVALWKPQKRVLGLENVLQLRRSTVMAQRWTGTGTGGDVPSWWAAMCPATVCDIPLMRWAASR